MNIANLQNLHTHTTYCDGALSPEGMVLAAIDKGCRSIGFSEHSYVTFDEHYSMTPEMTCRYVSEVNALKTKYSGSIDIFLGLEQDYFTAWQPAPGTLDYIIGTAHYLKTGDGFVTVDAGAKHQKQIVEKHFGGDFYAMAEAYYETISTMVTKTGADIIGHFDLIMKYNFNCELFDERHPRYFKAALNAMDEILAECKLFEVNTGAMYRLGKPEPYPSVFLLNELCKRGGDVILSSDSHCAESLCYAFSETCLLIKSCGFKYIKRLTKDGFVNEPL